MDLLASVFPDQLGPVATIALVIASFFTSALTAAVGLGGGIALIAVMANLMPASALVPVHVASTIYLDPDTVRLGG